MKPDKDKETDWEEIFDKKWDEIGMPDMERSTFNRVNKMVEEIKDPEQRLSELWKIKNGIETAIIGTHSWKGIALKRVESAIQQAKDEINYQRKSEALQDSVEDEKSKQEKVRRPDKVGSLESRWKEGDKTITKKYDNIEDRNLAIRERVKKHLSINPKWDITSARQTVADEFGLSLPRIAAIDKGSS